MYTATKANLEVAQVNNDELHSNRAASQTPDDYLLKGNEELVYGKKPSDKLINPRLKSERKKDGVTLT